MYVVVWWLSQVYHLPGLAVSGQFELTLVGKLSADVPFWLKVPQCGVLGLWVSVLHLA